MEEALLSRVHFGHGMIGNVDEQEPEDEEDQLENGIEELFEDEEEPTGFFRYVAASDSVGINQI